MTAVVFAPAAVADIDGIWDYSAEHWGPDRADRYIDDLRDACLGLASGNRQGRPVSIRPGYHRYPVRSHTIYFRTGPDRIEVIRILHQAQDPERHV